MKIAFIVTSFPEISETFILNQIKGLIEAGHDIKIFASQHSRQNRKHALVDVFSMMDKTVFFDIPASPAIRLIKGFTLAILNLYKAPKKVLKALNFVKHRTIKTVYYLVPFIGEDFDVFLCHYGHNGLIGGVLKELGMKVKLVTVFHANDVSEFVNKKGRKVYEGLFNTGDLFLPVSRYWKDELIKMGCPGDRTVVHHMGVDTNIFQYCERRSSRTVKMLSVSRLAEKKGHRFSIEALKKIYDKGYDIQYTIIGYGPELDSLKNMVKNIGLEKIVYFKGSITQEEILKFYREADIFVLPSITSSSGDKEGIPVALMEAMATGLPVLSTLHSGIPEIVEDGIFGFLIPEKDAEALAEKIKLLSIDPELRVTMGVKGRERVENDYNINKLNIKLIEMLEGQCR
jgi:colanic acid/amylovoran biosynthesis glycosyltransferase